MAKPKILENGNISVALPVSGQTVCLRSPKGRDLKDLETFVTEGSPGNVDLNVWLCLRLMTSPQMTEDSLLDLDALDFRGLVEAVESFRVFSKSQP